MNMFKKNGGFTLVELIVVIAILAILAGVAVPVYSGYISKANEAADYTMLDSVKTAAVFAYTEKQVAAGNSDVSVAKIEVTTTKVEVTGAASGASAVDVTTEIANYTTLPTSYKSGATGAIWVAKADATNNLEEGWNLTMPTK